MFDKVINDKEVSVKVTLRFSAIIVAIHRFSKENATATNSVEFITNTIHIIWGKQAIGLLINCKQMRIQQNV
jgi:hypothetical protein